MAKSEARVPAVAKKRPYKKRTPQISEVIKRAVDLMATGQYDTVTALAKAAGCSRVHLSRSLSKQHVREYMTSQISLAVLMAGPMAARTKIELARNAQSERVKSDCCSELLALNGVQVPRAPAAVVINNTVGQLAGFILRDGDPIPDKLENLAGAGYIVDLRTKPNELAGTPPALPEHGSPYVPDRFGNLRREDENPVESWQIRPVGVFP